MGDVYVVLDLSGRAAAAVRSIRAQYSSDYLGALPVEITVAGSGGLGSPSQRADPRPLFAEQLSPGDVVYFPEGPEGLHNFSNPTDEPVRLLAISSKRFPDVVAYPERGVAWVPTRHPERPVPEDGDNGIIARFDLPPS